MFTATLFLLSVSVLPSYFPPYVGFWKVVVACLKMGFSPCKEKRTACCKIMKCFTFRLHLSASPDHPSFCFYLSIVSLMFLWLSFVATFKVKVTSYIANTNRYTFQLSPGDSFLHRPQLSCHSTFNSAFCWNSFLERGKNTNTLTAYRMGKPWTVTRETGTAAVRQEQYMQLNCF